MVIGNVDLSLFAFCKQNGGGLMRRVMVGRLGGRKAGFAIDRVCDFKWRLS